MKIIQLKPEINLAKRLLALLIISGFTLASINVENLEHKTQALSDDEVNLTKFVKEENLRKHLFEIASDEYGGRGAGYEGEKKASQYIAEQFKKYSLIPVGDKISGKKTYFQNFRFHPRKPIKPFQMLNSQNVLGFIKGSDKKLKKEIVVIGCHYDGQGKEDEADGGRRYFSEDKKSKDKIWNSADDNGTSVAVLLEVARIISEQKLKPKRSILFIAFGAEEHALNGSAYYVENPVFKWKRHVAMLNLEKLGRIPEATPITASDGTSPIWKKIIARANQKTGMDVKSIIPELISDTDHYPFAMRKIPAMVIGMAHEKDTHLPTDSVDKISFDKLASRTGYVLTAFLELANLNEKIPFTGNLENEAGLMPVMASEEELNSLGLDSSQGGFKVSLLIKRSPAHKAGLRLGDFIISINNKKITRKNKNERIFFGENVNNNKELSLTILRKGKHRTLKIKFSNK